MTKRTILTLISFLALATPAQALKLLVWDSDMQTKLGAGESSGGKLNVQLVKDYSGPVKVLFSQSPDEKSKGLFAGLQSSYDGVLKNGQLSVLSGNDDNAPANTADSLSLSKFLQAFKLSVSIQTTSQLDPVNRPEKVAGSAQANPQNAQNGASKSK